MDRPAFTAYLQEKGEQKPGNRSGKKIEIRVEIIQPGSGSQLLQKQYFGKQYRQAD